MRENACDHKLATYFTLPEKLILNTLHNLYSIQAVLGFWTHAIELPNS